MNELKVFESVNFGSVRVVEVDGDPWFVGRDVANALGYANTRKAIYDHVDDEDKMYGVTIRDSIGRSQNPAFINESGLYSLVLSSKLQSAKQFKRWITSEVIPSIRKTGGYISTTHDMTDAEIMAKALIVAQRTIDDRDKRIRSLTEENNSMKPKALFADAVASSETSILVGELAKLLKQNGVEIGQNRLFSWLRENGYLIRRKGEDFNMPTQRAMELGLFKIREHTVSNSDGSVRITKTTLVTGKGQVYFVNKFLKGGD